MHHTSIRLLCFMLCFTLTCAGPAALRAQSATAPGAAIPGQFNARIQREDDKSLPYQLLIPKDYVPGTDRAWPLIIWLHGSGEKGTDNAAPIRGLTKTFLGDGAATPAFVLVPQCPPSMAWHATGLNRAPELPWSSRLLIAAIADVQREFGLDGQRIYLGGFSMGGVGIWELLARYPGVFAAAFPISGATGERPALAPLVKDVPIWVFHGERDKMASVEDARKIVAALKELGSGVKYTEYAGGGHEFARAMADPQLPEWLLSQRRAAPPDFTPAQVPDGATMILKTLPHGTHDTWTGAVSRTLHGAPRFAIDKVRYRLRPAPTAAPDVAAMLERIGKGELTGECEVTGTIELEDVAHLAVERIESAN